MEALGGNTQHTSHIATQGHQANRRQNNTSHIATEASGENEQNKPYSHGGVRQKQNAASLMASEALGETNDKISQANKIITQGQPKCAI